MQQQALKWCSEMHRVLITVFDALRPEFVTPELMPHLSRFMTSGAQYTRARSTFPTETRVNQSALTTGCMPRQHGIVGNRFPAPEIGFDLLNTGSDPELESAFAAGPVLGVPTLGQILTRAGRRFASLSAGTGGGGRLINWSAETDGSTRFAMRRHEACVPSTLYGDLIARAGPMPEYELPTLDWIGWAVRAYLDGIEPMVRPDVMLLWLCEPDESFHWHGIGSPEAMEAIAKADALFGQILEKHAAEMTSGEMTVIALSDHGQITLDGPKLDIAARLTDAGLLASYDGAAGTITVAVHSSGGLWVPGRDPDTIARTVDFLHTQDWAGPMFTRNGGNGTIKLSEICVDHDRAPDIALVCRADDRANEAGLAGTTVHAAPYPNGGGCHGGLHPSELHTVLAMGGAAIRPGPVAVPAGIVDILPTVLSLLHLPVPSHCDGRALTEAFADGPKPESLAWAERALISGNATGPKTQLRITDLGRHRYLDGARLADGPHLRA